VREEGAGGEAHEVQRVRHQGGLIEVVDAPDQPALDIAPGAEVLQMQVADGQDFRCGFQLGADLQHRLGPAPVGGAQEGERAFLHLAVLRAQVGADEVAAELRGEPVLVQLRRSADAQHWGASRGAKWHLAQ
jgi:hypothetical protein